MKIDGRKIASHILDDLRREVKQLRKKGITPHLAVILVGNDPSSLSYIRQKQQQAKIIGAEVTLHHFKKTPLYQKLAEFILELDRNPDIHGIIIQQPLPSSLSPSSLTRRVSPKKDIDGFLVKSEFLPPIGLAMFKILNEVYFRHMLHQNRPDTDFSKPLLSWLKAKTIVLIGRGETGGKPVAETFSKYRMNFIMLNSKIDPENKTEYMKQADIVISAVGKSNIVKKEELKKGAIVIGIGIHGAKGALLGDYNETDMAEVAGFYTPTPGGVGPVNVACLMQNLVIAAKNRPKKE